MGGNALAHLGVVRVTTAQVAQVYNRVQRHFLQAGSGYHAYLVPWIESKIDHGDIDLLVECCDPSHIREALGIPRGSPWCSVNGNVLSVALPIADDKPRVQVDFICVDEYMDHHRLYYSGGDFGLLLGRVAAWNGFTFAQEGLRLRHCPALGTDEDVLLTSMPTESLQMLGYWDFPDGFASYEELWSWVLASKFAHPDMFKPEATNAENRSRDKQRPMVEMFQRWLAQQTVERPCPHKRTGAERLLGLSSVMQDSVQKVVAWRREQQDLADAVTDCFGRGAVRLALAIEGEAAGPIIREMQGLLPDKAARLKLYVQKPEIAKMLGINAAMGAKLRLQTSAPSASALTVPAAAPAP